MNTAAVKAAISALNNVSSVEELSAIATAYKQTLKRIQSTAAVRFHVGETVTWVGKNGVAKIGTITKVNTKTVKITATDGARWSVSPFLLKKISIANSVSDISWTKKKGN